MTTIRNARKPAEIAKEWVGKLSTQEKAEIRSLGNADDLSVELLRSEGLDEDGLEAVLSEIERMVLRR